MSQINDAAAIIGSCSQLVLSDFSEGMVAETGKRLGQYGNIAYKVVDIQEIPFADDHFDAVIANMMLYHIPDIKKGLSEVRRVLKSDGKFYCVTYGEHGITEYLFKLLSVYGVEDHIKKNFTLQNGETFLKEAFTSVEKKIYQDALQVTNADDMVDYIYSLTNMSALSDVPRAVVKALLVQNMTDGVLNIPKEYGMFIAS